MPTSDKITLGGVDYVLPARFNVGELRDISMAMSEPPTAPKGGTVSLKEMEKWLFNSSVEAVAVALRRVAPEMTVDAILTTELESVQELYVARLLIMERTGLFKKKEGDGQRPKGEAAA